jgi:RimJ/RimL family protein N-acetyltransferase
VKSAPRLETSRLVLRGHRSSDLRSLVRLWADECVVEFITGKPLSVEDSWARLLRYAGHWPLVGYGYWAVESKETGSYIGDVGFLNNEHSSRGQSVRFPEVGWIIASECRGRGYGVEAVGTILAWADREMKWDATACVIDPKNTRSISLAKKLGFGECTKISESNTNSIVMFRHGGTGDA